MESFIPPNLRQKYLDRRKADLDSLTQALDAKDFPVFRRVGHQLQGNAQTYGYDDLADLGVALEKAGQSEDLVLAETSLVAYRAWVENNPTT